jgi:preprotein translocase subunit SecE
VSKTKKTDEVMSDKDSSDELPEADLPERMSSEDAPASLPEPRAARFGEGPEGKGARAERAVTGPRAGFFTRTSQFLHDVRAEMNRVSWPSASEVKNITIITIVAVIFFAVYLFLVDQAWAFLVNQIVRLASWATGA